MQEMNNIEEIKVWDLPVRLFHWTLVLGFATAFVSGEVDASEVHVWIGYALCVLLAGRVYWGFKGNEYARFRSFIFPVSETLDYVRSMRMGHPKHYFGHNPAGALMVFALLGLVTLIIATGLVTLSVIDFEGPLLFLANSVGDETSYAFRRFHHSLPVIGLIFILLHILGVIAGSIQHKENLVKAMITGKKNTIAINPTRNENEES